jgi:glycerol-3-phosphate dehydrogenase (NAD(P)+)
MPIFSQNYQVLYHQKPPKDAAMALLGREQKFE